MYSSSGQESVLWRLTELLSGRATNEKVTANDASAAELHASICRVDAGIRNPSISHNGRGGPLLSTQARSEFDCSQVRSRVLALTDFSGNEGSGKVVYSNSAEQKWEPVVPGSVSQTLWKVACGNDKIDQLPQF